MKRRLQCIRPCHTILPIQDSFSDVEGKIFRVIALARVGKKTGMEWGVKIKTKAVSLAIAYVSNGIENIWTPLGRSDGLSSLVKPLDVFRTLCLRPYLIISSSAKGRISTGWSYPGVVRCTWRSYGEFPLPNSVQCFGTWAREESAESGRHTKSWNERKSALGKCFIGPHNISSWNTSEIQVYFTSQTLVFTNSHQLESTKSLYKFLLEASKLSL